MNKRALTLLICATILSLVLACESTITGNEGNLTFSYVADDNLLDFNKPIAVEAYLDLTVREVGSLLPVSLQSASSDQPDVLEVVSTSGNRLTVQALAEGNVLLSVEARRQDGAVVNDSVNLTTRIPEVLHLRHSCTEDTTGVYLVNHQHLWMWFDMERQNGQPVIGYGYFPITIDPADSFVLDRSRKNQQWLHFSSGDTPAIVTITSTIDETQLVVELVSPAAIDGAEIAGAHGALAQEPTLYYLRPTVLGASVCQAYTPLQVSVTTPDVCQVSVAGAPPEGNEDEDLPSNGDNGGNTVGESGWIEVLGLEVGVCEFTANFTSGNDGDGTSSLLSLEIFDIQVERPEE